MPTLNNRPITNKGRAEGLLDDDARSPAALMKQLEDDVRRVRVGNTAPESVPVFRAKDDPSIRYVRFSDLSMNVRHVLDICNEVDVHVDGRRQSGTRNWRQIGHWRSPVLEWQERKGRF